MSAGRVALVTSIKLRNCCIESWICDVKVFFLLLRGMMTLYCVTLLVIKSVKLRYCGIS